MRVIGFHGASNGVVGLEEKLAAAGAVTVIERMADLPAAVEAVRQWEYTPTLLNGVPVPVLMTVTVSFSLQ